MDDISRPRMYRFDSFLLDRHKRSVSRVDDAGNETPIPIGSRAFDLLCLLVEQGGALLSKSEIMQAVWGKVLVEDANLTMQISTLRRILDAERSGGSCIQTIPGRGYRFLPGVVPSPLPYSDATVVPVPQTMRLDEPSVPSVTSPWPRMRFWAGVVLVAALGLAAGGYAWFRITTKPFADRPPLSVVVLPFENIGGDPKDDPVAGTVTDDLTTHLSHISGMFVIARTAARTYEGKSTSPREIGDALGVRYVLEGSVHEAGSMTRIDVELIETDTEAHLWSDRFDLPPPGGDIGRDGLVRQIGQATNIALTDVASARAKREHPNDPEAFDLILQARSLWFHTPDTRSVGQRQKLFERAVTLDPHSIDALLGLAFTLIEKGHKGPDLDRAEEMIGRARQIEPNEQGVLTANAHLLLARGHCAEALVAFQYLREQFPHAPPWTFAPAGYCMILLGRAEEAVSALQQNIRADPHAPYMADRYALLGFATLLLGRDEEAIAWDQRALAANPNSRPVWRAENMLHEAAANARLGHLEEAHRLVNQANQVWPWYTVRNHAPGAMTSPVYAAQLERYREAIALAGLRDHADEGADFGTKSDDRLHEDDNLAGPTPTTAPGVATILTEDLARLLAGHTPIIVDTMESFSGRSLPGAVGLAESGWGAGVADPMQDRLRRKMAELTGGDRTRAIVVVGWSSERFGGRNLALRLVALGYSQVYWYRGGREAWEVADLPEAPMVPTVW
jgi:adenylate cyclase